MVPLNSRALGDLVAAVKAQKEMLGLASTTVLASSFLIHLLLYK